MMKFGMSSATRYASLQRGHSKALSSGRRLRLPLHLGQARISMSSLFNAMAVSYNKPGRAGNSVDRTATRAALPAALRFCKLAHETNHLRPGVGGRAGGFCLDP